jgi:hypothetical protein
MRRSPDEFRRSLLVEYAGCRNYGAKGRAQTQSPRKFDVKRFAQKGIASKVESSDHPCDELSRRLCIPVKIHLTACNHFLHVRIGTP